MSSRFFFFFQAEDGIRDIGVTGVQTCALPISRSPPCRRTPRRRGSWGGPRCSAPPASRPAPRRRARRARSEERRVGEECRYRGWPYHLKKKKNTELVQSTLMHIHTPRLLSY